MKPRVAIVTAGHLATCPRMVKAADALADDGFDVQVVSTRSTAWAAEGDEALLAKRGGLWSATVVDFTRAGRPGVHYRSGVRRKLARALAAGTSRIPFPVATRAFARVHDELVAAAVSTGADFIYGGTTGGIAAAFEAARRLERPYALDLEDFFTGEPPEGSLDARLAERIEETILPGARFLTVASDAIGEAYEATYGVATETIHNVFPLPEEPPRLEARPEGPLRLYWFSQTIGPGRGLEEAIAACGVSGVDAELHLRGAMASDFGDRLLALAREKAPRLTVIKHPPGAPDEMTRLARGYDVGLSLEQAVSRNRLLCLTNKALVYLLAGLALALTDTPGHRWLLRDLGGSAVKASPGDLSGLADGFRRLASDREYLLTCRRAAWRAASTRWHWEHPEERGRLLRLFEIQRTATTMKTT